MQPVASADYPAEGVENPARELDDFDALVRKYWPRVFRFALASLRDPDAAGSVAQDCLMKAHRKGASYRGESSVSTWLMRIAVNLVRDRARSRRMQFWKRTRESAANWDDVVRRVPQAGGSPEAGAAAREQVEAVWKAAGRLPARQRTVFLLRFVEDMDLLEIAAATGLREGTVKAHLFRALEAVRRRIEGAR
jgi:RNA polymerase sigma-70 factor (ECF subfamily)